MVNPTGYTALDMIGFTDKGTYSPSETYVKNDLVHYSGNIWKVLIDDITGITPSEGVKYTLFIGEPSNLVEQAIAPMESTPSTTAYTVGRRLFYNNKLYEVITAIAVGDNLVTYEDDSTNANIKLSAKVEEQIDDINATLALKAGSSLAYLTDDTLENTLASNDILPFYDYSASAKRKIAVQQFGEQLISNPNLVDNPWFTINQRGENAYTNYGSSAYCYDRWIANSISNTSLSFSDDNGLVATVGSTAPSASPYITQRIDASRLSVGDTYTVSMLVKSSNDNTVYLQLKDKSGNNILNSNGKSLAANTWTVVTATGVMTATTDYYELRVYFNYTKTANDVSCVKAVKLEKGIVSTILLDNKPNYTEELLKCQRYYFRLQKANNDKAGVIGYGYIQYQTTNDCRITLTLPTEMRAIPSVSINEPTRFGINTSGNSSNLTSNATITANAKVGNLVWLQIVDSSLSFTSLAMITLTFNKKNDYIELSADL